MTLEVEFQQLLHQLHYRGVDRDSALTTHERQLADTLLGAAQHPELLRLLRLFPLTTLNFTVKPVGNDLPGYLSLAVRLESGRQYAHVSGMYLAQQQPDEGSALSVAFAYKVGRHVIRQATGQHTDFNPDRLEQLYQAALTQQHAVSIHALSSREAYFAEEFAAAVHNPAVNAIQDVPHGIFAVTFDL